MDPSKFHEDPEECSSNESGWTAYLGSSPDHELDHHDEDDEDEDVCSIAEQINKKDVKEDDADQDSDDSMASDASSGPSAQANFHDHVRNKNERKYGAKKYQQQKENKRHDEQTKAAKANSVGKSTKK